MDTTLLVVGIVCIVHALNALAPRKGRLWLAPSFFMSWLTIELAPWWLGWHVVVGAVLATGGGLDSAKGWVGLALLAASAAIHVGIILTARRTHLLVSEAIEPLELDPGDAAPTFPRSKVWFPFLMKRWPGTTVVRNIQFGEGTTRKGKTVRLRLDLTKPKDAKPGDKRPGLLQIHGGGWVIGDKREQGLPMIGHLVTQGWVAINANYRLSPKVGAPEHLIDCKRAIAWWREHAEEHGGDPDYLCVTGQSAGGHLTALVALTANDPRYQPGFEDVDTTMRAAVPIYGVYDFTNRLGTWHKDVIKRFFAPMVVQQDFETNRQAFVDYSPLDQVRPDAPPTFVVHGSIDTLAPVEDCREFVRRLREVSTQPVLYAEMAGAQHAFEIFPSYRSARVYEGIERFLHSISTGRRSEAAVADELVHEELVDEELVDG